ncbi:hypothetical protein C5S35_00400 [Candidatus Methanophagaceae archaeon]|nr:hypothetical protein C5S35_00400 [Methanophagales archaeon]
MSEWEEKLPPIMREKLARIGEITPEEKARIKDLDQLTSLLSGFYKGEITSEALWKELKDYKDKGKSYLLKEAQVKLIDSLSMAGDSIELQKRKRGILAIETLKEDQNTATIEQSFDMIEGLRIRQKEEMEEAYNSLKAQVESNPQLRLQQVKPGQVMQLTVDEAIKTSPEWNNFVANHEKRYSQEFGEVIQKLKSEVR